MADEEFVPLETDAVEALNEEDGKQYEIDLEKYTADNLEKQLLEQDNPDTDGDPPDTTQDDDKEDKNYKTRYENIAPEYTKATTENAELRKEIELLKNPEPEPEKDDEQFDPAKYEQLLEEDPLAAREYDRKFVLQDVAAVNTENQKQADIKIAEETTFSSIGKFAELDYIKEIQEKDPALGTQFGDFLMTMPMPKGGFTVKALERNWQFFRHDEIVKETVEKTKINTVKELNEANPEVITLTNAKDTKATNKDIKKMGRLDAAEAAEGMSEEELEKQLDEHIGK